MTFGIVLVLAGVVAFAAGAVHDTPIVSLAGTLAGALGVLILIPHLRRLK